MVNNCVLSPRQRQALVVLKEANGGLDKYQVAARMDISIYMAEIYLNLLWGSSLVVQRGNRYYINDEGIAILSQPMLPGMEAINEQ